MQSFCLFIVAFFCAAYAQAQVDITNKHNSSQPVEITAESLEVLQNENKAIFTGDVQAKQGDVDIRSEKMVVFYKKGGASNADKNSENKVSRVEIDRNVFISTPKETAQGSKGVYDVDTGIITLDGDVTLTSGKNTVKGQKLVYNLRTGQSKMVSGGGGKKERVRGVFVPDGKK